MKSQLLFSNGDGYYNYAPAIIATGTQEHVWWCQNEDPYVIRDFIYYSYRHTDQGRGIDFESWNPRQAVLAPSDEGTWDSIHVCDPAVIQGEFHFEGNQYHYAMFYLGTDQWDNKHNQIGVAFAQSLHGPWVKYDRNPIVTAERNVWGVGQPAVTSIDRRGRLRLFYSYGGFDGTYVLQREIDLFDANQPIIGPARRVWESGLTTRDGSPVIFHNIDIAREPQSRRYVAVLPRHPFDKETPSFVESYLQVASIDGHLLESGWGNWKVEGGFGPPETGSPRNHNAGLVRTPFGELPEHDQVRVVFAAAETGERWLWSYTLHEIALALTLPPSLASED